MLINDNSIVCIRSIMDKYKNQPNNDGMVHLNVNDIVQMTNEVMNCIKIPLPDPIIPDIRDCLIDCGNNPTVMNRLNCKISCMPRIIISPPDIPPSMPPGYPPSIPPNFPYIIPPGTIDCIDNCKSKTELYDRMICMKSCLVSPYTGGI